MHGQPKYLFTSACFSEPHGRYPVGSGLDGSSMRNMRSAGMRSATEKFVKYVRKVASQSNRYRTKNNTITEINFKVVHEEIKQKARRIGKYKGKYTSRNKGTVINRTVIKMQSHSEQPIIVCKETTPSRCDVGTLWGRGCQ